MPGFTSNVRLRGAAEFVKRYTNVLVAIPAFNEEITIGSIIAGCKKYVDNVVVVDDGSKDYTAELAMLSGADVISHGKNSGYGSAIRTCFEAARSYGADILVILDGDGQHTPNDIPALLEEMIKTRSDITIGSRFIDKDKNKKMIPAYRKIGMKILDKVTMMGSNLAVTDTQSGFRAYSRKAIQAIHVRNMGMGAGSEILMEASEKGLMIAEVPISVRYDIKGTSTRHPVLHGLSVIDYVVTTALKKRLA